MSTSSRVSVALEQLIAQHCPDLPEDQGYALIEAVSDYENSVWQIISQWGESNAWERAEEYIEHERSQAVAARRLALVVNDRIRAGDPVNDSVRDAWERWLEAYVENGDAGDGNT